MIDVEHPAPKIRPENHQAFEMPEKNTGIVDSFSAEPVNLLGDRAVSPPGSSLIPEQEMVVEPTGGSEVVSAASGRGPHEQSVRPGGHYAQAAEGRTLT